MRLRCDYEAEVVDGVICITDLDKSGVSVTNAIENVLDEIKVQGFDMTLPIIYRDSRGVWDGVRHRSSVFQGFLPLHYRDRDQAVRAVKP